MSFPIDTTIPAAGNNPSNDQPKMLQNNINVNSYLTVDHVVAGAAQNGIHLQSSYLARTAPLTLVNSVISPNGSNGIAYTNSATVGGSTFTNDYYYFNGPGVNQSNYPLNLIRGYGLFIGTVAPAPATLANGFNMAAGIHPSLGLYAISFTQPASGLNYGILISAARNTGGNTAIFSTILVKSAGGFTVRFTAFDGITYGNVEPDSFTVAIIGV